jgi:Fe-S oxidoreductase
MALFPATLSAPQSFSLIEKWLFLALAVVSFLLFWLRFREVLSRIMGAKRDADFHLFPLLPRVKDFVWEVLCQAKVIRQRPLPGLAHAFVFWAFLAFALVTLNHCAVGWGMGFLDPAGWFGRLYFGLAALFAVTCAVSIVGLFVRRFFLRPKWLGDKLSYGSGVIAGLIFVLMVSYLAAFSIPASTFPAKALWWVHTIALLTFLPLIPHTKHLHLVLSPVSVFLSRGSFSRIPLLSDDEDFGHVSGSDLTRLAALQAYSCVECGRCTEHCPAANTGKVLNPKQIVLGLRDYLNELGPASQDPLLGRFIPPEAPFQCTTCGACEFQCPVGVEHLPLLVGLRRGAVNTGTWDDERGGKLFLALERTGNPLGSSPSERDKFIQKLGVPWFDGSQEYCLWLGCMGAYDPKGREIVSSLVRILDHLGASYGVLRKERCSGDSARRLGNDLLFQQLAEANLETMASAGVKKLLSICPHCVRTIQEDWKPFGAPPEIEHHTEFLARHIEQLPQDRPGPEKIVYHDPCYLGRYRDVYDAPRALVSLSGSLLEPPRSGERSFCCGAGGGLTFLGEETGERVSHNRARELVATGATTVAAACPFCNTMLGDALASTAASPPQLLDIAQLIARGLPDDSSNRTDIHNAGNYSGGHS